MSKPPGSSRVLGKAACTALATVLLVLLAVVPAAAQARSGSLDRSFGTSGKITRTVNPGPGGPLYAFQIAHAPDGGIFVLAGQNLLRYTADGRPDPSFGDHGEVILGQSEGSQFEPTALAVDSQGRALVAGTTTLTSQNGEAAGYGPNLESGETATVLRFTPTGKLDTSFGVDGVVSSTFGFPPPIYRPAPPGEVVHYARPHVQVTGLVVGSENRPILTGTADTYFGACRDELPGTRPFHESFVARLTVGGEPDPTFNGTGVRADSKQFSAEEPTVDPSGGIAYIRWVGAQCEPELELNGAVRGVASVNADGIPNPAFGADELGQFRPARSIAFDRSGGVLLLLNGESEIKGGGERGSGNPDRVVRLHPNGTLDKSFGRGGTEVLENANDIYFNAITTDSRGRVLVAGQEKGSDSYVLILLRSNGKVDRQFGRSGRMITSLASNIDQEPKIVVDRRSGVLLGGWIGKGEVRFAVARYLP